MSNYGEAEAARTQFEKFEAMYGAMSKDVQSADTDIIQQRKLLMSTLHGA